MQRAKLIKAQKKRRIVLTPHDSGRAIVDALSFFNGLSQEDRWEEIYQSSSDTISVTRGSADIAGIGSALTDRLGDVWIAVGVSGFTPDQFYKIEAIKDDLSAVLEHEWQNADVVNGEYYLFRPKRCTLVLEAGNYDVQTINADSWNFANPLCLSVSGETTDAQIFFGGEKILQALFHYSINSGSVSFSKLRLTSTIKGEADYQLQQMISFFSAEDGIANALVERCIVTSEFCDWGAFRYLGTVVKRNNIIASSYEGGVHAFGFDKLYAHGNICRTTVPIVGPPKSIGHYKAGSAILVTQKASGNPARKAWIHDNEITVENDGGIAMTAGIYFKNHDNLAGSAFVNSRYLSSNNVIEVRGDNSNAETQLDGFIAGIYSNGGDAGTPADSGFKVNSHGDIITLIGAAPRQYGYKANSATIDVWRRPDSLAIQKTGAPIGIVNIDGVAS